MPIEIFLDRDKGQKPNERTRIECICTFPMTDPRLNDGQGIWLTVYATDENDITAITDRLEPEFPAVKDEEDEIIPAHKVIHETAMSITHAREAQYLRSWVGKPRNTTNFHKHFMLSEDLRADEDALFNRARRLLEHLIRKDMVYKEKK